MAEGGEESVCAGVREDGEPHAADRTAQGRQGLFRVSEELGGGKQRVD